MVTLFGKRFNPSTSYCMIDQKYKVPRGASATLYVRTTNKCDANCGFCTFKDDNDDREFNPYFLLYILDEARRAKLKITKVAFTGGEPTLALHKLDKALEIVKKHNPEIFTVVNTNGANYINPRNLDSLALSVHTSKPNAMFGREDDLAIRKAVQMYGDKLHLSCTLTRGLIDNLVALKEYLDYHSSMGVRDFGFVTLMETNDYAKKHKVSFDELDVLSDPAFYKSRTLSKSGCACSNYLYTSSKGELLTLYARHNMTYSGVSCAQEGQLVLDIDSLKHGFNGEVLIKE